MKIRLPSKKVGSPLFDGFTNDQRQDVDRRLFRGDSAREVYEYVKEAYGLWAGTDPDNTDKAIRRYRKNDLTKRMASYILQANKKDTGTPFGKKLDAMEELEELIITQKSRFMKMYLKEKDAPLLMSSVTTEAMNLRVMLSDYAKLQLETGTIRRAPKIISGTMADADGNVKSFTWTEEQEDLHRLLIDVTHAANPS